MKPVLLWSDALFFLHTARLGRRMNDEDRREHRKLAIFKYVVRYADGKSEEVPICSEIDIDHYVQKSPHAVPGAQVAWVGSYENSEDKAVAYARQWNNPHSDVEIASVDMVYIDKELGVPALLAITAAKAAFPAWSRTTSLPGFELARRMAPRRPQSLPL